MPDTEFDSAPLNRGRLLVRQPVRHEPQAVSDPTIDRWYRISVEADALTGEYKTVVATDGYRQGQEASCYRASLKLVSADGKLEVMVLDSAGSYSDFENILFRIDGGTPETVFWEYQSKPDYGYSPDNDLAFIERLKHAETVVVRVGGPDQNVSASRRPFRHSRRSLESRSLRWASRARFQLALE